MKPFARILTVLMIVSLVAGCAGSSASPSPTRPPDPAYWPTDGWRTSMPEEQGMDSELLAQMFDAIDEQHINLRSVLIVRNGYLVTEAYFHPYTQNRRHMIASVTKSVVGMLVGIAIDQGYIKDVKQPLLGFYPGRHVANPDANKQAITLEHLLSLTAGFDCDDTPESGNRTIENSQNWVAFMLDLPMSDAPGARFNYCSGAVHLVSAILQKATGKPAREFANENVFKPLGISEATVAQWGTDPQGISTGGYGLYLTPRDMAKLGFLYLNGGKWDGKQIVPAEYVAASTTQHTTKEDGSGYGYLWTVYPSEGRYAALGFAGQQIHVVPDLSLVVVFTSGLSTTSDPNLLDDLLKNYILPSAKSTSPLPAKPAGVTQLETRIRIAANPQQPVPALPKIAQDISGKTYTLGDASLGLQTFALTFQEGQDTASVSINGAASVRIGLNNLYSIQESPDGLAGALRGYWENENTFIVEELRLGNLPESEYRLIFTGDEVTLTLRERLFGGAPFEVHGVRQD